MTTKPTVLIAALMLAGAARAAERIEPERLRRADDPPPPVVKEVHDMLFHESRPDPLHKEYEELFAEPYPEPVPGERLVRPFKPFEDVQKFNEAVERYTDGIPVMSAEKENKVALQVRLPEGQAGDLNVWVNRGRVLLSYAPSDQPPGRWRFYKRREHSLPLPDSADPRSAEITRDGDVVTITFTKRG